jgi:hypothetical protein
MAGDKTEFHGYSEEHWFVTRTTGDDERRWEAVDAIRHICSPSVSIPLLIETLRTDSYWRARALAAHALCDLAYDANSRKLLNPAVEPLIQAMGDESRDVCEQSIATLGLLGQDAAAAIPTLRKIADGGQHDLAAKAKAAISAIQC